MPTEPGERDGLIDRVVGFSIRNRALVIFVVLAVGAFGVRAMAALPIDAVPDVTNVQVQVLTNAPALGPLEVEQLITSPVESAMSGLPGLAGIRSLSKFGLSAVTIVFEDGTDIYFARQLVAERLQAARGEIPAGYGQPEMGPISSGLGEIFQFEVRGEPMCEAGTPDTDACFTAMELRTILDWYVAPQLRTVPGVVEVNSFGGELKTYEVQLDPARLTALRISLREVFAAIERNNANAGGAYLERAGEQALIRGEGRVTGLEDIRRVVVATRSDGTPITVGDLATVAIAPMVRQGAVTRDGRGEIVAGITMMLLGANSREVAAAVSQRIAEVQPTLPTGARLETFYDRTELVDRAIHTVATNLVEGGVLVVVVLLLLLGTLRGGLLVASAIPLSMLAAFIAMRAFGVSGNLMSLGAIDFGLIVDGSVVMAENIVRVLAHRRARGRADGVLGEIEGAGREVARPVVFAVGIIMLVYLPILTLEGIEGKLFRPMALTVIFALAASLLLALTWVPAMSTFVFRRGVSETEPWLLRRARAGYLPLLARVLARPRRTFGIALVALAAAFAGVPCLGAEFVPTLDEGALAIQAVRLPSVSLEQSLVSTTALEKTLLAEFPDEVRTVVSKTGRPEIATDPMGVEVSDIFIILEPHDDWTRAASKEELVSKMEAVLSRQVPGQVLSFSQPIELRTNELISGVRSDVAIGIYGDDLDELERIGDRVVATVGEVAGAADVKAEQTSGQPFLRVRVRRDAIARHGINAGDVLDAVEVIGGRAVGEVFEGQRRFALQVRYRADARSTLEAIRDLPIAGQGGRLLPLGQLADLVLEEGPAQVSREQNRRRLTVEANVRGRDLAGFVAEAKRALAAAKVIPAGYFIAWGGELENLENASARLMIVVPATLVFIFVLLYMIYGSARPAAIIYLNVPFAATGGVVALLARGMPFSISAGVGFIALFGIAVLNGVVLVSSILRLQDAGLSRARAAYDGASTRLRPVLMTAMVASLGFIPMALATSAGAEVQRPLATVVIGGLISATALTLLVLPAVYAWLGPRERVAIERAGVR
jgi:cobalt-zinc-cadmium resistance protein CzcA